MPKKRTPDGMLRDIAVELRTMTDEIEIALEASGAYGLDPESLKNDLYDRIDDVQRFQEKLAKT